MRITIHHEVELGPKTLAAFAELRDAVVTLLSKEGDILMTLDKIQAAVNAATTVEQSAIALMNGLTGQLRDIKANMALNGVSGGVLDPDTASKLNALASSLQQNSSALAAAITANTATPPDPASTDAPTQTTTTDPAAAADGDSGAGAADPATTTT